MIARKVMTCNVVWYQRLCLSMLKKVKPVTPQSHQAVFPLLWHFLQRAKRSPKTIRFFFVMKGLSQRPNSNQGIATDLTWCSIAFLWSSCWWFSVLSWSFCLSRHSQLIGLTVCCTHVDISMNIVQFLCKSHGWLGCFVSTYRAHFLTLSRTTNFRLFQTERVCRWQFQIWWKW